jgi:ribosomal protein S1
MLHYRELSYNELDQDLKKFKKSQKIKVKIIEIKDDKLRFSVRAMEKDPFNWFKENKKKEGSIITTRVHEVLRTGVKVSVDPDKKIIVMIKKNQLAKESTDARVEIFEPGNALDAMITELDLEKREVSLSVKAAQVYEEKSLVAKFGAGAAKSGATLAGIFQKALGKKPAKKKKEEE